MSASKSCLVRLQREYKALVKEPVPNVTAHPLSKDVLQWHYVLEGSKGTEYEGGVFHGKIIFPPQYPFKPPSLMMVTPNGRFATNTKLCLSMTDYHPESWNPVWSVGTILTGLLSFMYDDQPTTGSISCSKEKKRQFARQSLAFNVRNPAFRELFPEWVDEYKLRAQAEEEKETLEENNGAGGNGGGPDKPETNRRGARRIEKDGGGRGTAAAGGGGGANDGAGSNNYGTMFSLVAVAIVVAGLLVVPLLNVDFTT
ncbi:hypothetical protein BSKO_00835 [Bryopsis sp. KO-2023]|nr:hypothetical protein BSKO_00835 [Bryopsis sp. KO-2023]